MNSGFFLSRFTFGVAIWYWRHEHADRIWFGIRMMGYIIEVARGKNGRFAIRIILPLIRADNMVNQLIRVSGHEMRVIPRWTILFRHKVIWKNWKSE